MNKRLAPGIRVVELYGGPGSGKSTTAALLFAKLKLMVARGLRRGESGKLSVELVTEAAKDRVWRNLPRTQAPVFGEQYERLLHLFGKVDIAVSDSPLWLASLYADTSLYPPEAWNQVIAAHYRGAPPHDDDQPQIEALPVFICRVKPYETRGRWEDEQHARAIDRQIRQLLKECRLDSVEVDGDERAADVIVEVLRERKWIE